MKKKQAKCLIIKPGTGITHSLGSTQNNNSRYLFLTAGENTSEYDDKVVLNRNAYKHIFGKTLSSRSNRSKKLSVIKIQSSKGTIYRRFCASACMKEDCAALTVYSIRLLGDIQIITDISLSKTNYFVGSFLFHWFHPNSATRVSMQLGVISIVIGIIGIATAIFL